MNTNPTDSTSKKHGRDLENDSDEIEELDAGAFAQMTRSQRKCHRERRRRSEVNKGFEDLTSLLWEIDAPTMRSEIENRAQHGKKQAVLPTDEILLSRVDLINCTISLLRRLNAENEEQKGIIKSLTPTDTLDTVQTLNLGKTESRTHSHNTDRASVPTVKHSLGIHATTASSGEFQGGHLSHPTVSLESRRSLDQQILEQRLLLAQLSRTQPSTSGVRARSIHETLNPYLMQNLQPQSNMSGYRNGSTSLSTVNTRNPTDINSSGGLGDVLSSESASLLGSSNNSDLIAMVLARHQQYQNISHLLNNNISNMTAPDSAAVAVGNVLGMGSTDTTRQLLQRMQQNRHRNSNNDVNLAQIEALLQLQLQKKPPGR